MRPRVVLTILTAGLAVLYAYVLIYVIGIAASLARPAWWDAVVPTHLLSVRTWALSCHTAAILLVSLPFALVLARLFPRRGVWVALAITVAIYGWLDLPGQLEYFGYVSAYMKAVSIIDAMKLVGILPVLVWLIRYLPSNKRLERAGYG